MLQENQWVKITWHNQTRKHYEEKGYVFTKYKDCFTVRAEDLSEGNHTKVVVICDYCGKEFKKDYSSYIRGKATGKDCCCDCQAIKNKEVCLARYGVVNGACSEQAKLKQKQTLIEKYGVDNPMKSQIIKTKLSAQNQEKYGVPYYVCTDEFKTAAKQSFVEKYGVENPFASKEIQEKIKRHYQKEYGADCVSQVEQFQEKKKQTCLEKYGVPFAAQAPEVIAKMRQSLYKNGSVASSDPERKMCDIIETIYGKENCERGYAFDKINFDCLLTINNVKIDIEYDGWYWHKNRQEEDRKRNYFLRNRGFKVIRFLANVAVPSEEEIKQAVDYIVKGNHSLYIKPLDIDI